MPVGVQGLGILLVAISRWLVPDVPSRIPDARTKGLYSGVCRYSGYQKTLRVEEGRELFTKERYY